MHRGKNVRALARLIKPYGLRVVEGAHRKIVNTQGQAVYWFAGSPSCPYFAENVLHDLIRNGLVPVHLKRHKIRD